MRGYFSNLNSYVSHTDTFIIAELWEKIHETTLLAAAVKLQYQVYNHNPSSNIR